MKKSFGHSRVLEKIVEDVLVSPHDLPTLGIHYHANHLRRLWQRGDFPKPLHLSPRKIAWKKSVIMRWIASKTGEAA